jgi:hypothetical protein
VSAVEQAATKPNPAAILLHRESRECIRRALLLIDRYTAYVTAPNNSVATVANKALLENYVKSLLDDNIISVKAMLEFLGNLESIDQSASQAGSNTEHTPSE